MPPQETGAGTNCVPRTQGHLSPCSPGSIRVGGGGGDGVDTCRRLCGWEWGQTVSTQVCMHAKSLQSCPTQSATLQGFINAPFQLCNAHPIAQLTG